MFQLPLGVVMIGLVVVIPPARCRGDLTGSLFVKQAPLACEFTSCGPLTLSVQRTSDTDEDDGQERGANHDQKNAVHDRASSQRNDRG